MNTRKDLKSMMNIFRNNFKDNSFLSSNYPPKRGIFLICQSKAKDRASTENVLYTKSTGTYFLCWFPQSISKLPIFITEAIFQTEILAPCTRVNTANVKWLSSVNQFPQIKADSKLSHNFLSWTYARFLG